ncbi:MAG: hypothetical protein ACRENS_04580 [Candidatus Eiseniibacteriota bacterium]
MPPISPRLYAALRSLVSALLLALTLLLQTGSSRADAPSLYLSWHAPWGEPGATDTLMAGCDTTRADTLWLSFNPGHPAPTFLAMGGNLLIHPAAGDSLSAWWRQGQGSGDPPMIRLEMDPDSAMGYAQPYRTPGGGGTAYYLEGPGTRLGMIYATPYMNAISVTARNYVFGRLILTHPAAGKPGCREPVCIEWADAELSFDAHDVGTTKVRTGGHRFVSLNSPGGAVAVPYIKAADLKTWKPDTWPAK